MTDDTALDQARRTLQAAPDDDAARLAYYRAMADHEFCLLLDHDPRGQDLTPRLFDLGEGPVVLAFDGEDRLGAFVGGPQPFAALPGRVICQALAGQGAALGIDLQDETRAFLMPPEAVDWLARFTSAALSGSAEEPEVWLPAAAPGLAPAIAACLSGFGAVAARGWLAGARHPSGRQADVLVLEATVPADAASAMAKAAAEAMAAALGPDRAPAEIAVLAPERIMALGIDRCATPIALSLPVQPLSAAPAGPAAPGSDPDRPPRLR